MTRHLPATVLALTAALLAVPAIRHWRERPPEAPPPPPPLRAAWTAPEGVEIGAGSDYVFGLALAPDGRRLVFPGASSGVVTLWLHDLRSGDTRQLPGTDQAAAPFWSPDGSRVGFFAGAELRFVDLASGTVSSLGQAPAPRGGAWNAAGDIVFAPSPKGGLMRRTADGAIAPFTNLDSENGETAHAWPAFLDDGRHVVFLVTANNRARAGIWITAIDNPSSRQMLVSADTQPLIAGDSLLFLTDQLLVTQRIDLERLALDDRRTPVALAVGRGPLGQTFATASSDVLIHRAPATPLRDLLWMSRDGKMLGRASEPVDAWDLRIAPDGRRVAVTEVDPQLRTLDVFIRSGAQPVGTRLSPSTDVDESAVWSPDGLRVAWVHRRRSLTIRGAGAVLPEQTIATFDSPIQAWDWSRDGRTLVIGRGAAGTGDDLWMQTPREGTEPQPYELRPFNQIYGALSPDGRWIAYASDESGKYDIYVDTFPTPGTRIRVTTAGGTEPRWSRNGSELFFRRGSEIHVAVPQRIRSTDSASSALSEILFDAGAPVRSYDVSSDGRFLLNLPAQHSRHSSASPIALVHHWQK